MMYKNVNSFQYDMSSVIRPIISVNHLYGMMVLVPKMTLLNTLYR